ncbi:glycosyltransferase [Candidatus Gracilibacteria bacterium]|nr:glycosyltransferase [Candidatus Gracilibacteria bacterium]
MKILFLTPELPVPADSGAKVRAYHLLRYLAEQHTITLVTFASPQSLVSPELQTLCSEVYTVSATRSRLRDMAAFATSWFTRRPFAIERWASVAMERLVSQLVFQAAANAVPFDLVHADQLVMAQFAEPLLLPRLIDMHYSASHVFDLLSSERSGLRRWHYRREAVLLRRYERSVAETFEAVTLTSTADQAGLHAQGVSDDKLTVIPLAVDAEAERVVQRSSASQTIINLASLHWQPNVDGVCWFGKEVLPLVRRALPDAELLICGAQPPPVVYACAERTPGIIVTGYLPDPYPQLERSAVLIVPQHTGGAQPVKILEGLARGIPVVATGHSCVGVDVQAGTHLLVADTPSAFADAIILLLREPEFASRLASTGREHVLAAHNWRSRYPLIEAVYTQLRAPRTQQPLDMVDYALIEPYGRSQDPGLRIQ